MAASGGADWKDSAFFCSRPSRTPVGVSRRPGRLVEANQSHPDRVTHAHPRSEGDPKNIPDEETAPKPSGTYSIGSPCHPARNIRSIPNKSYVLHSDLEFPGYLFPRLGGFLTSLSWATRTPRNARTRTGPDSQHHMVRKRRFCCLEISSSFFSGVVSNIHPRIVLVARMPPAAKSRPGRPRLPPVFGPRPVFIPSVF